MRLGRFLPIAVPCVLACTFGLQAAHADIYTWTDASGRVNVSNLSPPSDARVTHVVHEISPPAPTVNDSQREAAGQAEVRALSERVQQLEAEASGARSAAPPDFAYARVPVPPPSIQYNVTMLPPAPQYNTDAQAPQENSACDPTWTSCMPWWGANFYPAPFVIVRTPAFHRSPGFRGEHPFHGQHHVMAPSPNARMPGHFRKG